MQARSSATNGGQSPSWHQPGGAIGAKVNCQQMTLFAVIPKDVLSGLANRREVKRRISNACRDENRKSSFTVVRAR